jgi:hypothetical protein
MVAMVVRGADGLATVVAWVVGAEVHILHQLLLSLVLTIGLAVLAEAQVVMPVAVV